MNPLPSILQREWIIFALIAGVYPTLEGIQKQEDSTVSCMSIEPASRLQLHAWPRHSLKSRIIIRLFSVMNYSITAMNVKGDVRSRETEECEQGLPGF